MGDVSLIHPSGHSMGCSISALLASSTSTVPTLTIPVLGMVAICPRARGLNEKQIKNIKRLARTPDFIVEIMRWFDRFGGEHSASVNRVVGQTNERDLRQIQLQWNRQSRTSVVKRITVGMLPAMSPASRSDVHLSKPIWRGLHMPLLLCAGEADHVTPPEETDIIIQYMTEATLASWEEKHTMGILQTATNGLVPTTIEYERADDGGKGVIEAISLPAPAAHAFLYAHTTYRLVSALIESFLATRVDAKLDFGYQLQLLTTSGKWDVKNLQKWKAVLPVSGPIDTSSFYGSPNGLFRALKTMRQQDDEHTPTKFLEKWADEIYAVIDISHDVPVYNTKTLETGGVRYHKFPCVSKIPPTPTEVRDYCSLVDKLIEERDAKADKAIFKRAIATHCHYGFNRTGFFICSYLVTRCNYTIQQAIDEFARAKPPGIKHEHFLDVLWLRFAGHTQSTDPQNTYIRQEAKAQRSKQSGNLEARRNELTIGNMSDTDTM